MLQGWETGEDYHPTSITWNGAGLTRIALSHYWSDNQHGLWYLVNPTPGTNGTISISGGDPVIDDGGIIAVINLSGVDTGVGASGIRSSETDEEGDGVTVTLSPTTTANDLIISIWSQQESTSTTGQTYGGTSGTQSVKNGTGFNGDAAFVTTSQPTASGQNVTFLEAASSGYPSGLAISVAGEAGGQTANDKAMLRNAGINNMGIN
jgi:hypothetical protein